jgi:hypothetical protein
MRSRAHEHAREAVPRQCDRSDSIVSRRSLVLDDRASRLVLRQIGITPRFPRFRSISRKLTGESRADRR